MHIVKTKITFKVVASLKMIARLISKKSLGLDTYLGEATTYITLHLMEKNFHSIAMSIYQGLN